MPDDDIPSVRKLVLKPREVTRTDAVARPGDGTEISVPLIHRQNRIAEQRLSLRRRDDGPRPPLGAGDAPAGFAPLRAEGDRAHGRGRAPGGRDGD